MPSLEQKPWTVNSDSICLSWSLKNFEVFNIDFLRGKLIRPNRQRNTCLTARLPLSGIIASAINQC